MCKYSGRYGSDVLIFQELLYGGAFPGHNKQSIVNQNAVASQDSTEYYTDPYLTE